MLAKVRSMGLHGIEAYPVEVEVYVTRSEMPRATLVGLPDASVKESIDRVRAALRNSGYRLPSINATVNLAPADRRKEGPAFELPIALGLIEATDSATFDGRGRYAIVGELALDGRVRKVNGCLSMALEARAQKLDGVIVPIDNAREAAVVAGIDVIPVSSLAEAVAFLTGAAPLQPVRLDLDEVFRSAVAYEIDFSEVQGQHHVKRALEVAAAGGHNVLMIGPPGSGKSMMARRLCTILPGLSLEESLETTMVYSSSGQLEPGTSLHGRAPLPRPAPHRQHRRPGRRRHQPAPRRDQPRPPRRAVPGRAARVHPLRPGDAAPAHRGRPRDDRARADDGHLPRRLHAGGRDEPLPLRPLHRPAPRVPLQPAPDRDLPPPHQRPPAGPHRHPRRRAARGIPRDDEQPPRRAERGHPREGRGRPPPATGALRRRPPPTPTPA